MVRRALFKLVYKILLWLCGDHYMLALHYAAEAAQLAEIEYFGEGKILASVIITPDDEGGYVVGYYTEEELVDLYETD